MKKRQKFWQKVQVGKGMYIRHFIIKIEYKNWLNIKTKSLTKSIKRESNSPSKIWAFQVFVTMKTINISNPDEHESQVSFKEMLRWQWNQLHQNLDDNEDSEGNDCLDCCLLGAHGVVHHHPGQENLSSCRSACSIGTVPTQVPNQWLYQVPAQVRIPVPVSTN